MRRWLKLTDPAGLGLPEWVETVRPLSHIAPNCVTYDISIPTDRVDSDRVTFGGPDAKERLFDILLHGIFEFKDTRPQTHGEGTVVCETPFKLVNGRIATPRGWVSFGEDVFIGANCVIQRGIYGEFTELHDGVNIDSLCHIGHGVIVGKGATVTAGTILAGWVEIGEGAWLGIGSRVIPHRKVGAHAVLGAGAVVTRDVPAYAVAYGVPAKVHGYRCPCGGPLKFEGDLAACRCGRTFGNTGEKVVAL